jgi:hypothetical protein
LVHLWAYPRCSFAVVIYTFLRNWGSEEYRKNFIPPLPSFFRTKDHVLDLTSPIKKSKMVEGKHGGQRDGKRGKRE